MRGRATRTGRIHQTHVTTKTKPCDAAREFTTRYLCGADQQRRIRRRLADRVDEVLDNLDERPDRCKVERERVTHNQWLLNDKSANEETQ
jgi:hypothetical protein